MKTKLMFMIAVSVLFGTLAALRGSTPEQEKAFTEKYKAAFEKNDTATLESFLYTKGADPMALQFYQMMVTNGAGSKIAKIELVDLTPEEAKKANETMDGPNGAKMKLGLTPVKKLKLAVEHKDANGSSTSTSESFVAEKDGKLVIPVPVAVK